MKSVIKASPVKTRRKFDEAFKREAVQNWMSSGKPAAQVARELGLSEGLLFAWHKLLPPATAGVRRPAIGDLQTQLDAAQRETASFSAVASGTGSVAYKW
jgi:transposase-like protein